MGNTPVSERYDDMTYPQCHPQLSMEGLYVNKNPVDKGIRAVRRRPTLVGK